MSTTTLSVERRVTLATRAADYLELTKPRIAVLVLATVVTSGYVASWGQPNPWMLLHAAVGTALVAASASALNQWLERDRDAMMDRTRTRPLPDGRLSAAAVGVFAAITILLGTAYLAWVVNWTCAVWAVLTWFLYVWVYTPLKARTAWNTFVGAIAGALPMLIGWSATGTELGVRAAALFLIVFLWQFPHFMAIAWMYRQQYGRAGLQMLTVVDPSGRRAGVQAVLAAAALLPVSIVPVLPLPTLGASLYMLAALALGVMQLACAVAFLRGRDQTSARRLLRASLIYLPSLLIWLMVSPLV